MKFLPLIFFSFFLIVFSSCNKDKLPVIRKDCPMLINAKVLSEKERQNLSIYFDIYSYQSEIYAICNCKICDKIFLAYNCNNISLCDLVENCMDDFFEEAKYLFSVKEL